MFTLHLGKPEERDFGRLIIGGYDEKAIEKAETKRRGPADTSLERTKDGIFWMSINSSLYW